MNRGDCMDGFRFHYPTKVYFGEGVLDGALDAEIPRMGDTVMLAYGGGSIKRNGIHGSIVSKLEAAGKDVVEFEGIMPNPTYAKVQGGGQGSPMTVAWTSSSPSEGAAP